jgi:CHAT domain-containing protein/Tfp pilus assembly protein PilF
MTFQSAYHSALDGRKGRVVCFNIIRALVIFLLSGFLLVTTSPQALPLGAVRQSAQEASSARSEVIEPGRPIKRDLAGGQEHSYQISLRADQFLKVVVEQDGIDAVVKLFGPDDKQIIEIDSESRMHGQETVSWVAEETGRYRMNIGAKYKNGAAGVYEIQVVEVRKAKDDDRTLHEARKLNSKFLRLNSAGKYDEAHPLGERVLEIREKVLGPEHPEVGDTLNNLGIHYSDRGDYARAEQLFMRALAIREKAFEPEHPKIADSLNSLAILYFRRGDYAKAEPLNQRTMTIWEKVLGPEHPNVAISLNNIASIHWIRGDYAKVEPLFMRALAIREKALGPEHLTVAALVYNLASLYSKIGEYALAEPFYQRSLTITEKSVGPVHPYVALCLNNLANNYCDRGNYAKAEPLLQRALTIRENLLGPEHADVAVSLNNLANFYREKGDYTKAEPLSNRALIIWQKALGPENSYVATALGNLGSLYYLKGDYAKAEPFYQRALTIREKAHGPEHPEVADSLSTLAILYEALGDYAKAEPFYQRALTIREKRLGLEHPDVANCLTNLAILYKARGDYAKAEPLYERALTIREKRLGLEHPDVANSLYNLAVLYKTTGDYAKAEPLNGRALTIWEKTLGAEHPYISTALYHLAKIYAAKGDIAEAVKSLSRANAVDERNFALNLSSGSERQKLAYLSLFFERTDFTLWLQSQVAPNDPQALNLAFTTLLRRKVRGLDAMTDTIATFRRHATPQDKELFDKLTDARSQLATLKIKKPEEANHKITLAQLKPLEEQIETLEGELSARSTEFRAQAQPVTLAAVQAAIPSAGALVEFVVYNPQDPRSEKSQPARYLAYLLAPQGPPRWVDLGEAAPIDRAVGAWREALRGNRVDAKRLARELYEKVLRPVRSSLQSGQSGQSGLGEIRHLLIAPDGPLNLIPFAALVDEQNRYLIERYTISYLTSGRDLLRLQDPPPSQNAPLIVADPLFGKVTAVTRRVPKISVNSRANTRVEKARQTGQTGEIVFRRLPETKVEALAIKAVMPDASLLLQQEATEAALKRTRAPRILHIATHGFFLSDQQAPTEETGSALSDDPLLISNLRLSKWAAHIEEPLLRSGLALSGANRGKDGDDDGVLTALEVAGLDLLGTRLVVLSACDTGLGEVKNGEGVREGVQGLRRALVLAGSESQVMSLWPVTDEGAKELMIEYYRALQRGEGRSEGLRQVQLRMLRSKQWRHPFYWAAFIQSGEWANLDGRR